MPARPKPPPSASLNPHCHPFQQSHEISGLEQIMHEGTLQEMLQAWIVLCKYSDANHNPRPTFPLPDEPSEDFADTQDNASCLLHIPPIPFGQKNLINRFSGVESVLRNLEYCGWNFNRLKGNITQKLLDREECPNNSSRYWGPYRRGDFSCTSLEGENVISNAILSILHNNICDETGIVHLAQGLLDNEDGCLQVSPFRPASHTDLWPSGDISRNDMPIEDIRTRLFEIATTHDVPGGWRTFCAHISFYTRNMDFGLRIWWEQIRKDFIIRSSKCRTCLSGRSFLWWLGDSIESESDTFVSGWFVGGRQRLN